MGRGWGRTNPPGSQLVPLRRQVCATHGYEYSRLPLRPPLARKPYAQGPARQGRAHKTLRRDAGWWSRRGVMQPGEAGMCKHRLTAERA